MRIELAPVCLCIIAYAPLMSASETWRPALEASAGMVSEDALVLRDSDVVVDSGDTAIQSEVSLGLEYTPTTKLDAALNYSFSRTDYLHSDLFNLQTQVLSGATSIDVGRINIQLRGYHANAELSDAPYLTLSSLSPGASMLLSPRVYIMGQLSGVEKALPQDFSRDARQWRGLLRIYYMLNRLDHYFAFDYRYAAEDAEADEFDQQGGRVGGRWVKKVTVFDYPLTLQMTTNYYWQDFDRAESRRQDTGLEVSGELQMELGAHWFIRTGADYFDQRSTQEALRYEQGRIHFRVGVHL